MDSDKILLKHILQEVNFSLNALENTSKQDFLQDETLKRAIARSIEIVGEAVKGLSPQFTLNYPKFQWRLLAGMRDKLIHGYFSVDYEIVFDAVQVKFPDLQKFLQDQLK